MEWFALQLGIFRVYFRNFSSTFSINIKVFEFFEFFKKYFEIEFGSDSMILLNVLVKQNSENRQFFSEGMKMFSRLWTRPYKVKFFLSSVCSSSEKAQNGLKLNMLSSMLFFPHELLTCTWCCLVGLNIKSFKMFVPGWFDRRVPDLLDYWFLLTVTWQTRWKTWTEISLLKIQEAFFGFFLKGFRTSC